MREGQLADITKSFAITTSGYFDAQRELCKIKGDKEGEARLSAMYFAVLDALANYGILH